LDNPIVVGLVMGCGCRCCCHSTVTYLSAV